MFTSNTDFTSEHLFQAASSFQYVAIAPSDYLNLTSVIGERAGEKHAVTSLTKLQLSGDNKRSKKLFTKNSGAFSKMDETGVGKLNGFEKIADGDGRSYL